MISFLSSDWTLTKNGEKSLLSVRAIKSGIPFKILLVEIFVRKKFAKFSLLKKPSFIKFGSAAFAN